MSGPTTRRSTCVPSLRGHRARLRKAEVLRGRRRGGFATLGTGARIGVAVTFSHEKCVTFDPRHPEREQSPLSRRWQTVRPGDPVRLTVRSATAAEGVLVSSADSMLGGALGATIGRMVGRAALAPSPNWLEFGLGTMRTAP